MGDTSTRDRDRPERRRERKIDSMRRESVERERERVLKSVRDGMREKKQEDRVKNQENRSKITRLEWDRIMDS